MFCVKCGREIADGSRFCPSCGNAINSVASAPTSEPGASAAPPTTPAKKKSSLMWIIIGIVILLAFIAVLNDRQSPENRAAVKARENYTRSRVEDKESPSLGDALQAIEDVGKAWDDANREIKKGMRDTTSESSKKREDKDLKKSMSDLSNAWDAFKGAKNNSELRQAVSSLKDEMKGAIRTSSQAVHQLIEDEQVQDAFKTFNEISQAVDEIKDEVDDVIHDSKLTFEE